MDRIPSSYIWDLAETCLQETAAALHDAQAATPTEISHSIAIARESHAMEKPAELLEILARTQGHDEEHIGKAMLELGNSVAATLSIYQPLIPFGGKLIAPNAFYESFDQIHNIARILLSPVIFAEDTDAIGTASINPVASSIISGEIRNAVFKRFGIHPFVTAARLDYENWTFLCRKHFEL
ncbi:MAG: hypothetical protein RLZZ282_1723 [Verrucomicrobiota bacterium]|jgi:hypothetical protein